MKVCKFATAALACGVAWTLMVGGAMTTEDSPANDVEAVYTEMTAATATEILQQEAEEAQKAVEEAPEEQEDASEDCPGDRYDHEPTYCEPSPTPKAETNAETETHPEPNPAASEIGSSESEPTNEPEEAYAEPVEDAGEQAEPSSSKTCVITVGGVEIGYVYSYGWVPDGGAGVWMGSDSTTDGSWGYFVGHNPGSFWPVASIDIGDEVVVHDGNGSSRAYHVVDYTIVPVGSTWSDVSGMVTSYGESVALQTCVPEGYRVVVAA